MTYRYNGVSRNGENKSGKVVADSEIEAISKIRELNNVVLITSISKQSDYKVVQKLTTVRDENYIKLKNLLIISRTKRDKLNKKGSFSNIFKNKLNEVSQLTDKIRLTMFKGMLNDKKKKRETEETYNEIINIFNSETFKNLRNEDSGKKEGDLKTPVRITGVGDRNEGRTVDWDLLKQQREKGNQDKNKKIKVSKKDILLFTKRLQIMLASGMTLVNALTVLGTGNQKRGLSTLVGKIIESLQSGNTFSESLSLFPKQFDYLYVSLVSIGESSGTIHLVLLDIIDAKEQDYKINKQIKSSMVYPIIMGFVITAILLLGSIYFVPTFEEMFTEQGIPLPTVTIITFAAARYMPRIIGSVAMIIILTILIRKKIPIVDDMFIRKRDKISLMFPVIKTIKMLSYMYSFSFTVSLMLRNGIRLKDALEMSKETIKNVLIKEEIANVSLLMVDGLTMSEALGQQKHFDEIITNVALTGEESGQMSFSLEQIANYYKHELEKAIEIAMEFIEPASIILIAIIVVPVILAIYLPILDISSGATLGLQ